ncbi:MAG: hypothetical protein PVG79_10905 [Gemmatimonadales bacterium]|jgi:tetratricopeptide (TPR) repeat protein
MSRLKRLIAEIHERSLWQAVLVYLGASFAVLEAVDLFIDYLGLPRWLFPVALTFLLAGLPVVAVSSLAREEKYGDEVPAEAAVAAAEEDTKLRTLTWRTMGSALLGAMAMWGVVAAVLLLLPARSSQLVADRIVVDVFENRTGDAALDPLGSMAGHWLVQGLQATGGLRVVPFQESLAFDRRSEMRGRSAESGGRIAALAQEAGALIVVSGSYYLEGDELYLQAEISDVAAGELLHSPAPVGAPADSFSQALRPLQSEIRDFLFRYIHPAAVADTTRLPSRPPEYEAYQRFLVGMDYFMDQDWSTAATHFRLAAQLDSTYPIFNYMTAIALANRGVYTEAEPYVERLHGLRDRMTPYERATTDWLDAGLDGDLIAQLRAARRMAETGPYYVGFYVIAHHALELNRPAEALRTLDENDVAILAPNWRPYWHARAVALHLLGQHERELEAAREACEQHPEVASMIALELNALAALGRSGTVLERYDELQRLGASALGPLIGVGEELHAHGDPASAKVVWARVVSWLETEAIEDLTPAQQIALIQALEHLERDEEARALLEILAPNDSLLYMEHRGILAARRQDRQAAEAVLDWLADRRGRYLHGRHRYAQARVAAELGERQSALEFLRRALARGQTYPAIHRDHYLRDLRDYPPFQELVRPTR